MARVLEMLQLYLQLLAIACITTWAPPSISSVVALDSHRDVKTNFKVKAEYPEIATNGNKVYNEYSVLNHPKTTLPTLVHGKIVHETSPWCQKCWGQLL